MDVTLWDHFREWEQLHKHKHWKHVHNTTGCTLFQLMWSVNLSNNLNLYNVTAGHIPGIKTGKAVGWQRGWQKSALSHHVSIKWHIMSETVSLSGKRSNLSARQHLPSQLRQHSPSQPLGMPAGIHLKTAQHNLGRKVKLDWKVKQRECPTPVITSHQMRPQKIWTDIIVKEKQINKVSTDRRFLESGWGVS